MRNKGLLTLERSIILSAVIIAIAILMHGGIIKVAPQVSKQEVKKNQQVPVQVSPQSSSARVSVDDDPVLGSNDAKVTLIEFSDYECPFCKRHFEQVFPSLKKDYIDTGKVKMIFRDYPLPFHDPMATFEANAANCAREQAGDSAYYKIHDAIFSKTKSNGNGLTKDEVYQMASDSGLNQASLKSCADSLKFQEEIKKDFSDGSAAGVSGTPAFFIGKSDPSGSINGQMVVGAQSYSAFQAVIDPLLK